MAGKGRLQLPVRAWFRDENRQYKVFYGTCLLVSTELNMGGVDQFASFSNEFQGTGGYEIRDTICSASIDSITGVKSIDAGSTITWTVTFSGISDSTQRIEYTLDFGGRIAFDDAITGYQSGNSTYTATIDMPSGFTTLTVYPQCTTDVDGQVSLPISVDSTQSTF